MKARVEVRLDDCTYVALHAMYGTVHRALIKNRYWYYSSYMSCQLAKVRLSFTKYEVRLVRMTGSEFGYLRIE